MTRPVFPAAACLLVLLSSVRGDQPAPEHPAGVQVEITVSQGDKVLEKASLCMDLADQGTTFSGTTSLRFSDGKPWIVQISGSLGTEETPPEERWLSVSVSDVAQLQEVERDGNRSVSPIEILSCDRIWRGPGIYRLGEQGGMTLSLKVGELAVAQAEPEAPEKR